MPNTEILVDKYNQFILNMKPSIFWVVTRFVLHWLTLPIKLVAIGGLGTYQIITKLKSKPRQTPSPAPLRVRREYFSHVFDALPVVRTTDEELYVNRVPLYSVPDGTNHNTDHQCSRQGTYAFIMTKLGLRSEEIDNSMMLHIEDGKLARGYKNHFLDDDKIYNFENTSGDMLCGMSLGMLGAQSPHLKAKFRGLVENIVNSYDFGIPEADGKKKSDRGMWQPGLETVGAQALTLLAALRVAEKVCDSKIAGLAYKKMLLLYGYGVLSLFPTAYIDKQRGYFNDHNCLMAVYVLSKLSSNILGRSFWKIPMTYTWLLSRHWYNGYFTGLVRDCYPSLISKSYIENCQSYLNQEVPRTWTAEVGNVEGGETPARYNLQYEDEFYPDVKQTLIFDGVFDPKLRTYGGLGFIATAVVLENNPKDLL